MAGHWTPERVEIVRTMWREGHSASIIARRLGGFEHCADGGRSAVLGKAHRIGIVQGQTRGRGNRVKNPRIKTKSAPAAGGKQPRLNFSTPGQAGPARGSLPDLAPATDVRDEPDLIIPESERFSILTRDKNGNVCAEARLTEQACRWPFGDASDADFHFCGKDKVKGLPYCEFHSRRAYQPPKQRRAAADKPRTDYGVPYIRQKMKEFAS